MGRLNNDAGRHKNEVGRKNDDNGQQKLLIKNRKTTWGDRRMNGFYP
ncbi:hypothetical protein PG303_01395 [Riemerella anatipestifer]|uniref:Uncharacterized protein n=1 Tax=Riemerella anatipestifer TaxID=34085 RepID=A0AAP6HCY6_RIEAN|nr:hypothetical protein [Riemerella anatipestifer]